MTSILSIEEAITRLLQTKSFYAQVVAGITRRAVPHEMCPTMAVVCNPDTYLGVELIYSQKFIESIDDLQFFEFVVEHEMVHLVSKHIQRYWSDKRLKDIPQKMFNIAADMAVNSMIVRHYPPRIKEKVTSEYIMPSKDGFPDCLSMEEYALKIMQKYKDKDPEGNLINPHDWDSMVVDYDETGNPTLKEADSKQVKNSEVKQELNLPDYINKCVNDFKKSGSHIPSYVEEIISGLVDIKTSLNWKEILSASIKRGMPDLRVRSMLRPSRRLWGIPGAYKFPGKITDRTYKISFIIDTSGSMSRKDLDACYKVLKSLMDYYENIQVSVVSADTEVRDVQHVRDPSEFNFNLKGRGGTCFKQPLHYVEEEINPDIAIYTTDGFGDCPKDKPPFKLVWLLTCGSYYSSRGFGRDYFSKLEKIGELIYVDYK